ncbi:dTDP-4-dehydrorhamnose 3,5-epimerase family protein [Candidatus Sumerlaeota bacterium]|nr:dTDP-4-dehydrorhamnose 3,5-epimerase family protein [Candidatus Sumerlaeota bacterium]
MALAQNSIETGIAGVILRTLAPHLDSRGWLAEAYRSDESAHRPAMAYISVTEPGVARRPHEHRDQSDLFVFAGPGDFTVYLYDNRADSPTRGKSYSQIFGESRPASLIVPPGVIHAYRCSPPRAGWILNLPDRLYAGEGRKQPVDEIRHENDPNSPFYSAFDRSLFMGNG